ncbi:MAG: hypothetical protein HYZ46_05740 [Nitrosomonadales bacterium]|nr:hypothetical protein [Nitrosomonadales bacterium]
MKIFLVGIFVFFCQIGSASASESDKPCSKLEAYAAETVTDYLNNWENVYTFFKQFRHCYDASIAEGAADQIQKLWVNHWSEVPKMIALTNQDHKFKAFIWQRISDETFPQDDFFVFVKNAKEKCPKIAAEFCSAVALEATKVVQPNPLQN